MAGKDLTFKLVMDADVKSFITNLKQSEAQARAIFETIRQESDRIRQSTTNGAGGIDQLDRSLQSTTNTANQFDRQITTVNNDLNHTETSASAATTQAHALEGAFEKLMMTLAALGIGVTAKEMLDTADSYKTLAASVRVAIGEHGNLDQAMQNIIGVALRTNTSLEATAQLYSKITTATKDMGAQQQSVFLRATNATAAFKLSSQDILGLTETINKALQVSGGSSASAEAALFQLNQALGSGVLRGEEFNSVMEQAPRLARAMADGLGVTIGQLRNMANNGQLTSDVVTKSLLSQASVINGEFSKFPLTIGAATQNLKTSWEIYLGELDKTTGVTTSVAKGIKLLADNLDSVVAAFKIVVEVIGAYKATQLVSYLNAKSAAFTNTANSIRYSTTQLASNTAAELENARASQSTSQANNTQAQTARQLAQANQALALSAVEEARAESGKALAQLQSLQTTRTLVLAEMQLEQERLKAQITATGRAQSMTRMAELGKVQSQVTKEIAAAEQQLNSVRAAGTAAAQRLAAANNALATSNATIGQKIGALNNAFMAGISKIGAYGAALFGLVMVFDLLKKAGEAAGEGIAKIVLHAQGLKTADEIAAQMAKTDEALAKKANEAAEAKRKQAAAAEVAKSAALGLNDASKNVVDAFDKEIKAGNSVADAMKKVSDSFNFTNLDGINNGITALSALQAKGIATGDDIRKALANGLQGQDLLVFQTNFSAVGAQIKSEMDAVYVDLIKKKQAYDDFVKNSDGLSYQAFQEQSQKYQEDIDKTQAKATTLQTQYNNSIQSASLVHGAILDEAVRRTGLTYEELEGKSTKAFISAKNDVNVLIASLDELSAKGVNTSLALSASLSKAIDTATNQSEITGLQAKIEGLHDSLGTQVTSGLLLQAKQQLIDINAQIDKATPGFNSLTEALSKFGFVSKEQADITAQGYLDAYSVMLSSGKATTSQLKQALTQMSDSIYSSGNTAKQSWYENQIAINGLTDSVDGMGKHSVSAATQTADSFDAILQSTTHASSGFKDLGDSAVDQANRVSDAWDSAADSVGKAAKAGEKVSASNLWLTQDYIVQQLKSKGYDDAQAQSLAKQIYNQTKGQSNTGAAYASRDYYMNHGYDNSMYAQMRTGSTNLSNYAAVDEQLQKYADLTAQKSKSTMNTTSSAASTVTTSTETKASKTVRIEIINGQRRSVVYGDPQSADDLVSGLEAINKAGGGYQ
ncbi:tape measure protein [Acinetobacter sp. ANC 5502]